MRGFVTALIAVLFMLTGFGFFSVDQGKAQGATSVEDTESVSEEDISAQQQTGLMGMMAGVKDMEEFYISGNTQDVPSASGEWLAGANGVNTGAVNQRAFHRGAAAASELGYDALQAVAENQMSYNDYMTLLKIVEAEATGGDEKSKLLIANVVLNRVKDSRFPDTIYDVVWQRLSGSAQFQPTADGRINTVSVTDSTIKAVAKALNGEDPSQGALFFLARAHSDKENVEWFDQNLVKLYEYGGHEFMTYPETPTADEPAEAVTEAVQ